jgi:hypothetical protein
MNVAAGEIIKIPLDQIEPGLYIMRFNSGKNQFYGKLIVMQ